MAFDWCTLILYQCQWQYFLFLAFSSQHHTNSILTCTLAKQLQEHILGIISNVLSPTVELLIQCTYLYTSQAVTGAYNRNNIQCAFTNSRTANTYLYTSQAVTGAYIKNNIQCPVTNSRTANIHWAIISNKTHWKYTKIRFKNHIF